MTTREPVNLSEKPTSTLLDLLWFTSPDTEPYRDIVKELWHRDGAEGGGGVLDAADEYRDRLFRDAYDFRKRLDDEWERITKIDPICGEDARDPCPICHPDQYKAEFGLPLTPLAFGYKR